MDYLSQNGKYHLRTIGEPYWDHLFGDLAWCYKTCCVYTYVPLCNRNNGVIKAEELVNWIPKTQAAEILYGTKV